MSFYQRRMALLFRLLFDHVVHVDDILLLFLATRLSGQTRQGHTKLGLTLRGRHASVKVTKLILSKHLQRCSCTASGFLASTWSGWILIGDPGCVQQFLRAKTTPFGKRKKKHVQKTKTAATFCCPFFRRFWLVLRAMVAKAEFTT